MCDVDSKQYALGVDDERDRCTAIVSAARNGELDTDLRSILHWIRSGKLPPQSD